jgi:mono/diheme cytochrome c family protein
MAGANEAHFIFNFTNVLSTNITILNVHPSCGCTTAQLPPLPWTIAPGTNGQIGVTVNLAGKSGTVSKSVTVNTDKGMKILSVKITLLSPKIPSTMSDAERTQNMKMAAVDRQAVFKGDCISCHVKPGEGKFGKELYDADCAICHEGANRATMVPDLHTIPQTTDAEFWRTWISYGRPHSLMPAFAKTEDGPLTDEQIASLTDYLRVAIPSK